MYIIESTKIVFVYKNTTCKSIMHIYFDYLIVVFNVFLISIFLAPHIKHACYTI